MIKIDEKLICCLPNQLAKLKLAVDAIAKVDKLKLKAVFFPRVNGGRFANTNR